MSKMHSDQPSTFETGSVMCGRTKTSSDVTVAKVFSKNLSEIYGPLLLADNNCNPATAGPTAHSPCATNKPDARGPVGSDAQSKEHVFRCGAELRVKRSDLHSIPKTVEHPKGREVLKTEKPLIDKYEKYKHGGIYDMSAILENCKDPVSAGFVRFSKSECDRELYTQNLFLVAVPSDFPDNKEFSLAYVNKDAGKGYSFCLKRMDTKCKAG